MSKKKIIKSYKDMTPEEKRIDDEKLYKMQMKDHQEFWKAEARGGKYIDDHMLYCDIFLELSRYKCKYPDGSYGYAKLRRDAKKIIRLIRANSWLKMFSINL